MRWQTTVIICHCPTPQKWDAVNYIDPCFLPVHSGLCCVFSAHGKEEKVVKKWGKSLHKRGNCALFWLWCNLWCECGATFVLTVMQKPVFLAMQQLFWLWCSFCFDCGAIHAASIFCFVAILNSNSNQFLFCHAQKKGKIAHCATETLILLRRPCDKKNDSDP